MDTLLRRRQLSEAREAAAWLTENARSRLAEHPDNTEALRDLSISLDNGGNTDQALGDFELVRAAFAEGLEIADRLAAALPDRVSFKDLPALFRRRLEELKDAEDPA